MAVTPEPAARARSAVRSWVRAAGSGLRRATPYGIVAFLAASAVAPVAGAALGAPAEYAAALGQLGGMGSNYLADTLMSAADRARGSATSEEEWRDAIAAELLTRLEAGDERSAALREEVAALLRAVNGIDAALRAADDRSRQDLVDAFEAFGVLAEDVARSLAAIHHELAGQGRAQRQQTELIRQSLTAIGQLWQEVRGRLPDETGTPPAPPDPAGVIPYPGLARFDAGNARFFRGRETLVAELLGRLGEQVVGGPPLVVVGVSGVGKSSLLRAGVRPAVAGNQLGEDSGTWPWLIMEPGETPLAEFTGRVAALPAGTGRFVVLVDQFEELFTRCTDPAERIAFVQALTADRRALLIIAVRADFYPQCTELPPMVPLLGDGQVVVGPLRTEELRRAIREPAREAGSAVQPGLEELLLADLGAPGYQPGALPLLAHALRATWERRDGSTMTVEGYRRTGGIRRAVAESAERIYRDLGEPGRAALRSSLLSLVTVVDDTAVRRRVTAAEVDLAVLRPMIEERLVTAGRDTVEISHEALLTGWPRLAGWLVEAREEILLRQRLTQAAADWAAAGEDPDALYRGSRLAAAREWAAGRTDVPEAQRRFLNAAEAAAEAQQLAARRTTRRLRRLVAGLAVALVLVVSGGLVAVDQRAEARDNERIARSRQYAAESRTQHYSDQHRSVRSALQAWQTARTREARDALMYAQQTDLVGELGTRDGLASVAVSADGRRAAIGYPDGAIDVWDTSTLTRSGPALRHPSNDLVSVEFSPDGRFLVSGSLYDVVVWDVAAGTRLRRLPAVGAATWLPGSAVVVAGRTGDPPPGIGFWDAPTGRLLETVENTIRFGIGLAVSPDGRHLAVALGGDTGGEIVRRSDGRRLAALPGALEVAFDASGTLYGVGLDGPVRAWRPADGWKPVTLYDPDEPLGHEIAPRLGLSPDGTVFVGDGDVRGDILQLGLPGPRPPLVGFGGYASDAAVSADGRVLVVAGSLQAPTVIRLDMALRHPQIVSRLTFDPTGPRLATASADPVIRIWDTRTRALTATLPVDADDGALGLAYGPDGSLAAAYSEGSRVVVFGPDGKLRRTLRFDPGFFPAEVAFSPDGALLTVNVTRRDVGSAARDDFTRAQERDDPDVYVWDARTFAPRPPIKLAGRLPFHQAFTPDGRYLLVTANRIEKEGTEGQHQFGSVSRFRLPDLTLVDEREMADSINDIAVSPDSATVAVPFDRRVELLRVEGLTSSRHIGEHPQQLTRVAWSPDGRILATAADNDSDLIRLWDTATGKQVSELRHNSSQEGGIAFSPDGSTLAAGSNDWSVAQWRIDPDVAVRDLCARLTPSATVANDPLPALCR
jgi:WD40 repeat protein